MLSAAAFYQLSFPEQADLLSERGLYLQTRSEGNFIIDLYELDDLLVEIFYQMETEEPVSIMAYNTADKLKTLFGSNLQPRLTFRHKGSLQPGNYAA